LLAPLFRTEEEAEELEALRAPLVPARRLVVDAAWMTFLEGAPNDL